MAKRKKKTDRVHDEAIDKAIKTGFLFDLSINFYENHTRDELLEKGYREAQIECANTVLAHFDTSVGAKLGRCPEDYGRCARAPIAGSIRVKSTRFPDTAYFFASHAPTEETASANASSVAIVLNDPAEDFPPVSKRYLGKDESKRDRYEYICSWCAFTPRGYGFLKKAWRNRPRSKRS